MTKPDTRTIRQRHISARQEATRAKIAESNSITKIFEMISILEDATTPLDTQQVQRYKAAIDARIKMLGKYLPDLKAVELQSDTTEETPQGFTVVIKDASKAA